METSEIAKSAATISPNSSEHKHKMTAALKAKNGAGCGGATTDAVSNSSKFALLFNARENTKLFNRHVTTSSASDSIDENDCASISDKKKPLHLQIIEDGTCSSSDNDGRTSSRSSTSCSADTSPQGIVKKQDQSKGESVPVSSEREEIIKRETSNDSNDDQIIIESSKCVPIIHDKPQIKYHDFVPLGVELKREGVLKEASDPNTNNDPDANTLLREKKNDLDPKSTHSKGNDDARDDKSNSSSTPDLASMIPCADDGVEETIAKEDIKPSKATELTSSKTIKIVSNFSSDSSNENETDVGNLPTSPNIDSVPAESSKQSLTISVASALDQVLAELEESGLKRKKKDRPCILQQSLVGDSGSSGTSTPNEDVLDGKKADDKANSLQVKSSMLLPEDSLNVIAQMTLGTKAKKEKKNVVTFGEDSLISSENPVDTSSTVQELVVSPNKTIGASNGSPICLPKDIKMESINTIVQSPPNRSMIPPQNKIQKSAKKVPLISGTAAAVIAQKSSKSSADNQTSPVGRIMNPCIPPSKPLALPPQLMPNDLAMGNQISVSNIPPSSCVDESNGGDNVEKANGWEKGMSMLADIISNAAPMRTKNRTGTSLMQSGSTIGGQNGLKSPSDSMVPVGQSLRLYASIAAQAGISSYSTETVNVNTKIPAATQHIPKPQQTINEPVTCAAPVQEPVLEPKHYIREIGKIRRYNSSKQGFGDWEDLPFQTYGDSEPRRWCELNIDESIEIPLRRGGRLRVFPNFLGESRRVAMQNTMDSCSLYRQYSVYNGNTTMVEPRLQVLLSSQAKEEESIDSNDKVGLGYVYRGVSMKAKPISREPVVESLSHDLAELYRLPNREWNIGANLVYYRGGSDHTTWHADDTQGEALILCIVVESESSARPILVKPKTDCGFQDGDEEIIIFVGQGDAYEMDGQMQMNYEHCLPMNAERENAKRSVVIFRHGNTLPVSLDTGTPLVNDFVDAKIAKEMEVATQISSAQSSPLNANIKEGKKLYSKDKLVAIGAHRQEKKSICGSIRDGCESILVDNQDRILREDDGLCWLQITCTKSNGGGALSHSYHKKCCIRVFRSSELDNKYAPVLFEGQEDQVLYRYDGLYTVRAMWDAEGCETESPPTSNQMHTFFLMRQPKRPVDGTVEDGMYYNKISIQELWNEIQKCKGVRKPKQFLMVEPIMEIGRIGDKSNARRRPASSRRVMNNDSISNSKTSVKKKNIHVIPSSNYAAGNCSVFQCRTIYSSDSDSNDESDEESMESDVVKPKIVETLTESGRPTRRSAAIARSYLKEAMHNRYGSTDMKESPQKSRVDQRKKRSLWSTVKSKIMGKNNEEQKSKRQCKENISSSSDEIASDIPKEDDISLSNVENGVDEKPQEILSANLSTPDVEKATEKGLNEEVKSSSVSDHGDEQSSNAKQKSAQKNDKKRNVKAKVEDKVSPKVDNEAGSDETKAQNTEVVKETDPIGDRVKPEAIVEGCRVNVEYRNTLFKATIRKIRVKGDSHQYLIHYDGNKKSNVHWIPLSMVHEVLDEAIVQISPESKPRRGRKRKLSATKSKPTQPIASEVSNTAEPQVEEDRKFANGSEVYADYRGVLYLSTVRNSKKNRKGNIEYLIHYDGFKKTADRWMKELVLYEVDEDTTRRFNEQRGVEANGHPSASKTRAGIKEEATQIGNINVPDVTMSTRSSRGKSTADPIIDDINNDPDSLDMGDLDSGVEFLPGSCVFVVKANALYLAKMVKRRKKGKGTEYFVQFDGMSTDRNEWIPLSSIYELNPKTRKIYEKTTSKRIMPDEDDESVSDVDTKPAAKSLQTPSPKVATRGSKRGKSRPKKPIISKLYDMQNIEPGVNFLPGSTLFVQWKNGLYLGKMIKKRGKGDHMEYLIHYDGFKSAQDEWVSVSMVFEINPQTKRAFNKQRKKS